MQRNVDAKKMGVIIPAILTTVRNSSGMIGRDPQISWNKGGTRWPDLGTH